MSVELYPVISTEEDLRELLEEGDFVEMALEEEAIAVEELPTQTYISGELVACVNQFSSLLPSGTRAGLDQFLDVVCWDYRRKPQPLDSPFQPEDIHCSCSPSTCARLASALAAIDESAVREHFRSDERYVTTVDFFLDYLAAWRDIFQRAADSEQFVFAFVR
ncbi:MAG: hypothetical protein V4710_08440 [Verrucomicrobiota bacterium]